MICSNKSNNNFEAFVTQDAEFERHSEQRGANLTRALPSYDWANLKAAKCGSSKSGREREWTFAFICAEQVSWSMGAESVSFLRLRFS